MGAPAGERVMGVAQFQIDAPLVHLNDYWTDGSADRSVSAATLTAGVLDVTLGSTIPAGSVGFTNGVSINLDNLKNLVTRVATAKVPYLALPLAIEPVFSQAVYGTLTLRVKPPGEFFTSPLSATINIRAQTEAGVTRLLIEPTAPVTHSTGAVTVSFTTGTVIGQTYAEAGTPWLRLDFLSLLSSITKGATLVKNLLEEGLADFAIEFNGLPVVDSTGAAVQELRASAVLASGGEVIANRPPEIYREASGEARLLAAVSVEAGKTVSLIASGSAALKVFDVNGVVEVLVAEPEQGRLLLANTDPSQPGTVIDFSATDASIRSYAGRRWKVFAVNGNTVPAALSTLQFEADADALKGEQTPVWMIARDTREAYSAPFTALVTVSGPDRVPAWTTLPTLAEIIDTAVDDSFTVLQSQLQATDPEGAVLTYSVAQGQTQAGASVRTGFYGQLSIDGATGALRYQPTDALVEALGAGTHTDSFQLRVSDGVNTVSHNLSVVIKGANDAPSGAHRTLVMLKNTSHSFGITDFGFADVDTGDVLGAVRIDTLPLASAGVLKLGAVLVTAGQVIDAAQIPNLKFEPAANVSGVNAAAFNFSVRDAQLFDVTPNTISFDITASDWVRLSGQVYHWKNHALLGTVGLTLESTALASIQTATTGADGSYALSIPDEGAYRVEAGKSLSSLETGSVISAADALAALKLSVGINPNSDPDGTGSLTAPPVSPYQFLAADVNGDGRVSAADALAILKMAVKRSDAPARQWLFVNEAHDFWNETAANGGAFTTTRSAVPKDAVMPRSVEITDGSPLNLVAVLKGDVNGTWAAPTGSSALPDSYFQALVGANPLTMNLAQFGVVNTGAVLG